MVSAPLLLAHQVKQPKKISNKKELLNVSSNQLGAKNPGLIAWSLDGRRKKYMPIMNQNKLPIALHINPHRQLPKTIVIEKDQMLVERPEAPMAKKVLVKMPVKASNKITSKMLHIML